MKNTKKAKETTTRVRNSSNRPLWRRRPVLPALFLAIFAFGFFALLPPAQAVSPPPDGGYPNFNTAEGKKALLSLTTGTATRQSVGIRFRASPAAASTRLLALERSSSTPQTKIRRIGAGALLSNTICLGNTANGAVALFSNTDGAGNTAIGNQALQSNTIGLSNTANGTCALYSNTIGEVNTAIGHGALYSNTGGCATRPTVRAALQSNTTGKKNTALGY